MKIIKINKQNTLITIFLIFCATSEFGCWFHPEHPMPNVTVDNTESPDVPPTPEVSADFGLQISINDPVLQSSFISEDTIIFGATVIKIDPASNSLVSWSFVDNNFPDDKTTGSPISNTGVSYAFDPKPKTIEISMPYTGTGRNYLLNYKIQAFLHIGAGLDYKDIEIRQNRLAELRQEYLDFSVALINLPSIQTFESETWGLIPSFLTNILVKGDGQDQGVYSRHENWIIKSLLLKAEDIDFDYEYTYSEHLPVNSGYRCPAGNKRIGSTANNSLHLFGKAFDWDYGDVNNDSNSQVNWRVAKFIKDNYADYNVSVIILYDQYEVQYWYDKSINLDQIPDIYSDKPADRIFTHGHVDWRNGWFWEAN